MVSIELELGHVRELVEAKLHLDEDAARIWLDSLGVRCVGGVFSRESLRQALGPSSLHADTPEQMRDLLDISLRPFGLCSRDVELGRETRFKLCTLGPPRILCPGVGGGLALPVSEIGISARLYIARNRRHGTAYFLASGFLKPDAEAVVVFLLVSERTCWIARREDLMHLSVTTKMKKKAGRRSYGQSGVAPYNGRRGYLRVWTVRNGMPLFDPRVRVRDKE